MSLLTATGHRSAGRAPPGWKFWPLLMALLVLLPISVIVLSWGSDQTETWQHLIATQLGSLLHNTLWLVLGVGLCTLLMGVSLGWLIAVCEFPGRRHLDWVLMLPLAIPTYVVAFVALGLMSYSGPVHSTFRRWFGNQVWFPEIHSTGGVIFVMSAVLYPYVYMLARGAFLTQSRSLLDASRLLGAGPVRSFWRVALPMARPAIAAGVSLVLMETLADFGAVAIFNFDTFTTAIYKSWFGLFNLNAAAQLASLLLLFVFLALFAEQRARGDVQLHSGSRHNKTERYRLRGASAWAATAYCVLVVTVSFAIPVAQLTIWTLQSLADGVNGTYLRLIRHTFTLGVLAAAVATMMALLVSYQQKLDGRNRANQVERIATLGYALPGSVLAVGIMLAFAALDANLVRPLRDWLGLEPRQMLVGSLAALLLAYVIRFFPVAFGPTQDAFTRIRPSLQEAAQTLGSNRWQILHRLYVPLLAPGIFTALLLVFVDTMKEMPATLLMRPFGWDTLAVRVYEMTSEGEWQRAALPALTLVAISIPPLVLMIRRSLGTQR